MPAPPHHSEQRTKKSRQETATAQECVQILLAYGLARLDRPKGAIDREKYRDVDAGDREQKERRDACADNGARCLDRTKLGFGNPGGACNDSACRKDPG